MEKSKGTAYLLWALWIFGLAGLNKFYVGKIGWGIVYLLTFGFLGIGIFLDLFIIPSEVSEYNWKKRTYYKNMMK
jgi:TM2 domain-containing membrane protein YozV